MKLFTLAFIIRASTGQHSYILQCECEPNHAGQTGPALFRFYYCASTVLYGMVRWHTCNWTMQWHAYDWNCTSEIMKQVSDLLFSISCRSMILWYTDRLIQWSWDFIPTYCQGNHVSTLESLCQPNKIFYKASYINHDFNVNMILTLASYKINNIH